MKVKLLRYTPEGEKLITSAAKLCYSAAGTEDIENNLSEEQVEKFLNGLVAVGHHSPVEHVSFTFAVEGVSRSLTHQLVRHRIASFSQQSQRYVSEKDFEYITIPLDEIEDNDKKAEAYSIYLDNMRRVQRDYNKLLDLGVAKEDARYILPNAAETKIVVTMNARSLMHFFSLRTCNRAQWEIRELAHRMLLEVKQVYPTLFKNAGPACIRGKCPEGKMSCGKQAEMKELYG